MIPPLPGVGFSVAATTLVGQALSVLDPELARRAGGVGGRCGHAWRSCLAVMGAVAPAAGLLPHVMLGLFIAGHTVLAAGGTAMRRSLFTLPASGAAFIFIGARRREGDPKCPVLVRAAGTWGVRVPVARLAIPLPGLPGARLAMIVDFCTQAYITFLRFCSGRWRTARV